jgi:hypothetical protein
MARVVCPARDVDVLTHDPWLERNPPVDASELVVPVVPKTSISWQGRASTSQYVDLAVGVDVSRFRAVQIILRLHAKNTWTSTASAKVQLEGIGLDRLAPGRVFTTSAQLITGPSVSNATTPPWLGMFQQGILNYSFARVRLVLAQGTSGATSDQTFTFSVDLLGKLG